MSAYARTAGELEPACEPRLVLAPSPAAIPTSPAGEILNRTDADFQPEGKVGGWMSGWGGVWGGKK